jgi:hypothetical protein
MIGMKLVNVLENSRSSEVRTTLKLSPSRLFRRGQELASQRLMPGSLFHLSS